MPLVFSPLTEAVLDEPPRKLLPRHAFVMRQLGNPPPIDLKMNEIITNVFKRHGISVVDADGTVGSKDYLERILGLIRATGFTVAIFSTETRANSLANIALELGYAAMCGKPLVIAQSKGANGPSDLKRTDWIEYDPDDQTRFEQKLEQAIEELSTLAGWESDLLDVALGARSIDCAVAFERANKAFLLSGDSRYIDAARVISEKIPAGEGLLHIADLERLRQEIGAFILQSDRAIVAAKSKPGRKKLSKMGNSALTPVTRQ